MKKDKTEAATPGARSRARIVVQADGKPSRSAFTTYRVIPSASSSAQRKRNVRLIFGADVVDAVEASTAASEAKRPERAKRGRPKSEQLSNAARVSSVRRRTA
ncbi:hypothetical protein [Leifsonia sp. Root227]|uniref:hypothetical protein n=1 Tax=Leifsonia sp. Root227 TaxID=1736496 RepID=UPI000A98796C|nr:hypothetical protein [Leifsonia sp. Root227]